MGSSCSIDRVEDGEVWCRPLYVPNTARKKKKKKNGASDSMEVPSGPKLCKNGRTNTACAFTQQGHKGVNQDAMLIWENFGCRRDTTLCAIFDGHGPYGHFVSRKARRRLPSTLLAIYNSNKDEDNECDNDAMYHCEGIEHWNEIAIQKNTSQVFLSTSSSPSYEPSNKSLTKWRDSILKCCTNLDRKLRTSPTIDFFCSGTTTVIVLKKGEELLIANVGDSRAVLGTLQGQHQLGFVQLTTDLKPNVPKETERILRCKGRVFSLDEEPEVPRVWLPDEPAPGLAMARAFGDFCLKDHGLICVPDITYRRLCPSDQFVILATDGIWDVLSNKEAVEVVFTAPEKGLAAKLLVQAAVKAWKVKYPACKVDDCTVVCLFFTDHAHTKCLECVEFSRANHVMSDEVVEETEDDSGDHDDEQEEDETNLQRKNNCHNNQRDHHARSGSITRINTFTIHDNDVLTSIAEENASILPVSSRDFDHEDMDWPAVDVIESISSNSLIHAEDTSSSSRSMEPGSTKHDCLNGLHEIEEVKDSPGKDGVKRTSSSRQSLAECLSSDDVDDDDWSALQGVARVNSVLHLPRSRHSR